MAAAPLLYDLEAVNCVNGACLLSPTAVEIAHALLVPSDIEVPTDASIFEAIGRLYRRGEGVDYKTVADELRAMGVEIPPGKLTELQAGVPAVAPASVTRYCKTVLEFALRRRLAGEGAALVGMARDLTRDPGVELDAHRARLADIDSPIATSDPGDVDLDEFIARPIENRAPWIAPGLFRSLWRVLLVAPEGVGKSMVLRQIAVCVSCGVHPFTFEAIEPRPALLIDLENPPDVTAGWLRRLVDQAKRISTVRAPGSVWLRPGGIDLRRRRDRVELENILRRRRPELVALGPFYKAYSRKASEPDEAVAGEVQEVLDDLRTRFNFALVGEHHAPKAQQGHRDLSPFGSSLWLRWPELGLKLVPIVDRPGALRIQRWRGDRAEVCWPDELHRDRVWPFVGKYAGGVDDANGHGVGDDQEPAF